MWAIGLSLLVVLGMLFPVSPLVDAETLQPVGWAALHVPTSYAVLAPLGNVLDALTLFSVPQHIALAITVLVVFCAWLVGRRVAGHRPEPLSPRWSIARSTLVLVAVLLAPYVMVALLPRPMAAISLTTADDVAVDFHSHTERSHDGRKGFSAEANRARHHDAGFNVAYVTDHASFEGGQLAERSNPATAGDGTLLIGAIELRHLGKHDNVYGAEPSEVDLSHGDWRLKSDSAAPITRARAMRLLTIPGDLSKIPAAYVAAPAALRMIELVDGAPRGLGQASRDHARILHLADSLNLAVVAGSNDHGWSHTATAWSVLRIPGWRAMNASQMDSVIRATIVRDGRHAVRVLARRRAPDRGAALMLTVPTAIWLMMRTLSPAERISWLLWIWGLALLLRLRRR